MAVSFASWWANARNKEPRQVTWIYGSETVLVDHIVEHLLGQLKATPSNLVGLRISDHREELLWPMLEQAPLDPRSPRVLVIRDAEQIEHWDRIQTWLKGRRYMPNVRLIFVSNDAKEPRVRNEEDSNWVAPAHLQMIRKASGLVVGCGEFTEKSAAVAVAWVRSLYVMKASTAGHLLNRADGNLRLVRDAALKLRALEREATIALVNQLVPQAPRYSFVDALIHLDRKTALQRIPGLTPANYRRSIALLDSQLTFLNELHHLQARQASYADMARVLTNRAFLIREFLDDAKNYDNKNVTRRRALLAFADSILKHGASVAVMEALVLNW